MKKQFSLKVLFLTLLMIVGVTSFAQVSVKVSGKVTDAKTGETVPGAAILVKGSSVATVTDVDGNYSISVPSGATLVCQCLGYTTAEAPVNSKAIVNFSLEVDSQMLEETVVVGYGTLKKSQLVGSVESVSGEVLEDRVNADVTRSLEGQVPGLTIVQLDGKPSHGGEIHVRGNNTSYISKSNSGTGKTARSIGQGGGALVLIDGVEGDLGSVNPDDVESISVLKDASSSVIYGARAAYGVILVTTKDAKGDKVSVSYNGTVSINQRSVMWEDNVISDGLTYVETFYDFWLGNTATPAKEGTAPTKMNIYKIPSGENNYLELYRQHVAAGGGKQTRVIDGSYVYFGYNENYLEQFYKRCNVTQQHNLSVSGSSKRVNYSFSGRYYGQDGIYKIGNEKFNSFNFRSKISVKATSWLTVDNNTSLYKMNYSQPMFAKGYNNGSVGSQLWQISMAAFPVIPARNEDGTYTVGAAAGGYAAFADGNSGQDDSRLVISTTTGATITFIKDVLKLRGDFTYKNTARRMERYVAPVSYSTAPGSSTDYVTQEDSYKTRNEYNTDYMTANVVLTWTPKWGENHKLNFVGGWNLEDYNYHLNTVRRMGMLYPSQPNFELMDGTEVALAQDASSYGLVGFFARANYTLLNRYIFEVSARADGSSKFPVKQQWGVFPSGSIGWRISEEKWMSGARGWLSNLKIRANAGTLGNGNISPYKFLTTMGVSKSTTVFDGGLVSRVTDPEPAPDNLSWERVTTYDVGLDMDVLKSRLSLSADYYVRNTTDLYITGPEIPATFGASTPQGNYGALKTKGWELTLAWKDQVKLGSKDFRYGIKASVWDSRTWVTKYYNQSGSIYNYYEGKELGEIWGFESNGYFLSNEEATAYNNSIPNKFHNYVPQSGPYAGDLRFEDLNGDRQISTGSWTLKDHGDLKRIGNEMPRYQFGLNMDFHWNGIGLSAFFQGVGRRDWYPSQGSDFFWGGYARAYVAYVLKDQAGDNYVHLDKSTTNWTVTNPGAYWTRRTYGVANSNTGALTFPSSYYLQNAAYVRLKNLTLDYTFSGKWLEKANISKLRLFLSGENLFTLSPIYKHTSMFDPEIISNGDPDFHSGTSTSMGDGYSYPLLRTFTLGLNLTF